MTRITLQALLSSGLLASSLDTLLRPRFLIAFLFTALFALAELSVGLLVGGHPIPSRYHAPCCPIHHRDNCVSM